VVAPTYTSTSLGRCWREFLRYCPKELIQNYPRGIHRTPGDRHIDLIGDRLVYFKSADRPDTLAGEGLSWIWCDEPAQFHSDVWERVLPPALMERHGIAWFTGTPNGRNWYFRLFQEGQDPLNQEVQSWNHSSYQNSIEEGGYIPKAEIDQIAARLPWQARQQEIMGTFLQDTFAVFRGVDECVKGKLEEPNPATSYVGGIDVAKHADYTVICIIDNNGHLVAFDRFGDLDWDFQRKRIKALVFKYAARTLIDSSGVGDPMLDELQRKRIIERDDGTVIVEEGLPIEGYKFTHASKAELIENLSLMIEQGKISYPNIPDLVSELKIYGWTKTKGDTFVYNAPEGYHDDCVIALALAAWQVRSVGPLDISFGKTKL
jgi:hypothetical protein